MDEKILRAKKVLELREIAKAMEIPGCGNLKKAELIEKILDFVKEPDTASKDLQEASKEDDIPAKESKATKDKIQKTSSPKLKKAQAEEDNAKSQKQQVEEEISRQQSEKENPKSKKQSEDHGSRIEKAKKIEKIEKKKKNASASGKDIKRSGEDEKKISQERQEDVEIAGTVEAKPDGDGKYECDGILELADGGFGFLRFDNFLTGDDDVYVSPTQIKRFNLKTGDRIRGIARKPRQSEKFGALIFVGDVNGDEPGVAKNRPDFENLTPIFPNERLSLEDSSTDLSTRLIDLVAPIGKGQRGLIVAGFRIRMYFMNFKTVQTPRFAQGTSIQINFANKSPFTSVIHRNGFFCAYSLNRKENFKFLGFRVSKDNHSYSIESFIIEF